MSVPPAQAVKVFYSYAHIDARWRQRLAVHLKQLERERLIVTWYDREIRGGADWAQEIDERLNTASLILLLLSPDFINSDYCYGIEMGRALERNQLREARVIPILLRPCDWRHTPLSALQIVPRDNKPIVLAGNHDSAFVGVAEEIRAVVEEMTGKRSGRNNWNGDPPNFSAGGDAATGTQSPASPPASTSSPGPLWNVPHRRNPFFTGQEAILAELHARLHAGQAAPPSLALSGLGGIGKTQIAIEYAYRQLSAYDAVLWVVADPPEALLNSFGALAGLLCLDVRDASDQERIIAAVRSWLDTHTGWLLILDNANEIAQVSRCLPQAGRGHILLTTQATALGSVADGIAVRQMDEQEGALLLLRRAHLLPVGATNGEAIGEVLDQVAGPERVAAEELARELGGLPLALDQAGAYIEETGCSVAACLERYRMLHMKLLERRGSLGSQSTEHPTPVATTLRLSLQKVEKANPVAADLLCCCAFLHPDAIPEAFFGAAASLLGPNLYRMAHDPFALDEAIEALRTYSLLRRDPGSRTLTIHRLVQAVVIGELSRQQQRTWANRVVRAVNKVFPDPKEFANWPVCERYILHAQVCAQHIRRCDLHSEEGASLLNEAGYYLAERAAYAGAEQLFQQSLAIRERIMHTDHPRIANVLNNLASLYNNLGRYREAERYGQRAFAMRERVLGPDHQDTAQSLNNLAMIYYRQKRYEQAAEFLQRALVVVERVRGSDHPDTLAAVNNLMNIYYVQGRHEEAARLLERVRDAAARRSGPDHPDVALYAHNLALIYRDLKRYEEAESCLHAALAVRERVLGDEHPDVAYSLSALAVLYYDQGRYSEAGPLLRRALAILEHAAGLEHPDVARVLRNLALVYHKQGRDDEVRSLEERIMRIEMRAGEEEE
jgi:tetratricopeptide (TPR) repeat protein